MLVDPSQIPTKACDFRLRLQKLKDQKQKCKRKVRYRRGRNRRHGKHWRTQCIILLLFPLACSSEQSKPAWILHNGVLGYEYSEVSSEPASLWLPLLTLCSSLGISHTSTSMYIHVNIYVYRYIYVIIFLFSSYHSYLSSPPNDF